MTLLLESSSSLDLSEDPFSYVPLGHSKRRKSRKKASEELGVALGTRQSKRLRGQRPSPPCSSPIRCSECGMPWSCLKTYESPSLHKGFCSVRITRPEDRELIPDCPQGRDCRNTMALHYELKRHEHIQWKDDPPKDRRTPVLKSQEAPASSNEENLPPIPFTAPPIITNPEDHGFSKTPIKDTPITDSAKKRKKTKRLFSDTEKPLFKDLDSESDRSDAHNNNHVNNNINQVKENCPLREEVSPEHAHSVVLPVEETLPSFQFGSTATSHEALEQETPRSVSCWEDESPQDAEDLDSHLSQALVKDYIQGEVERYKVVLSSPSCGSSHPSQLHSTPLKTAPREDGLSPVEEEEEEVHNHSILNNPIYKQFIEEEIQRNREKTLTPRRHVEEAGNKNLEVCSSFRDGVQVSAKKDMKDGGIHVSVKVTDPDMKLEELEMKVPAGALTAANPEISRLTFAGRKQASINDFFGGKPKEIKKPSPPRQGGVSSYPCPFYKRISRTSFVVDAFNYGYIPGVSLYFLSHFHRDHYIGLTHSFSKPIVCSRITATLLRMQIKVNDSYIRSLDLNMERTVDGSGVTVTLLEANHCPGAVMFLFKFPDGTATLHTGDFRAVPSMEEYPQLWDARIKSLYLDTTYCSPQHDFPAQDFVIRKTVAIVKEQLKRDPNTMLLVGTYTIGKERIFMAIAEELNRKIYPLAANKSRILNALEEPSLSLRLVVSRRNPDKSFIHILSVKDARSVEFLRNYRRKFKASSLLSIVPTGWTKESASFKVNNREPGIYSLEVPYSEHSSYSELKRFVQFINLDSADDVVPTVNVGSHASRSRMKKIFQSWVEKEETPFRKHGSRP